MNEYYEPIEQSPANADPMTEEIVNAEVMNFIFSLEGKWRAGWCIEYNANTSNGR